MTRQEDWHINHKRKMNGTSIHSQSTPEGTGMPWPSYMPASPRGGSSREKGAGSGGREAAGSQAVFMDASEKWIHKNHRQLGATAIYHQATGLEESKRVSG